jgi:hypothetical protein
MRVHAPIHEVDESEYMQQLYDRDRKNPNALSNWYPRIKDAPGLKTPHTVTIPVPIEVFALFADDRVNEGINDIKAFLERDVIPQMRGLIEWFMKNGCFSNKFDFRDCVTNELKILNDFISIQYASICIETGGASEINLRQVIPWYESRIATIYHGMPIRTEIRVFYDFSDRRVLYAANYWDYEYCRPNMYDRTDQIVFDAVTDEIAKGFEANWKRVSDATAAAMCDVDMSGKWSIDILIDDSGDLWLIDMAQAERSAYWSAERAD